MFYTIHVGGMNDVRKWAVFLSGDLSYLVAHVHKFEFTVFLYNSSIAVLRCTLPKNIFCQSPQYLKINTVENFAQVLPLK